MTATSNQRKPRRVTRDDGSLGTRIRVQRNAIKMSQETLAGEFGVSFQQVQKWERGINRVSGNRIVKLAEVLQTDVNYLLGIGEEPATADVRSTIMAMMSTRCGYNLAKAFVELPHDRQQAILTIVEMMQVTGAESI
jgi:transcriptional regulator with XRE-family HTH domain